MQNTGNIIILCIKYVFENVSIIINILQMGIPFCDNRGFPSLSPWYVINLETPYCHKKQSPSVECLLLRSGVSLTKTSFWSFNINFFFYLSSETLVYPYESIL